MNRQIEIVDRVRGMQLSTSRITVQDLVQMAALRAKFASKAESL